jgi:hypothetical protein
MFDCELSMVAPLAHLACCPAGQLMPGNGTRARLMNSSGSPGYKQRWTLEIEGLGQSPGCGACGDERDYSPAACGPLVSFPQRGLSEDRLGLALGLAARLVAGAEDGPADFGFPLLVVCRFEERAEVVFA